MSPSNTQKDSAKTTREKAAAARAKAESEQRRRDARNRTIGIVIVVALIGLIFGGVFLSRKGNEVGAFAPDANAAVPAGVDRATWGVVYGKGADTVPQLQLWEDFQCPGCKKLEQDNGKGITGLADKGTIRLLWRPTSFLDGNLRSDASQRAIAAWGCAIDAGRANEYHSTIFANQPEEGVGYTQDQLVTFGQQAGITGAAFDTFKTCVTKLNFAGWAANSQQEFERNAVPGTPLGFLVLGDRKTELKDGVMNDNAKLQQAIKDFTAS